MCERIETPGQRCRVSANGSEYRSDGDDGGVTEQREIMHTEN